MLYIWKIRWESSRLQTLYIFWRHSLTRFLLFAKPCYHLCWGSLNNRPYSQQRLCQGVGLALVLSVTLIKVLFQSGEKRPNAALLLLLLLLLANWRFCSIKWSLTMIIHFEKCTCIYGESLINMFAVKKRGLQGGIVGAAVFNREEIWKPDVVQAAHFANEAVLSLSLRKVYCCCV